MISCHFLNDYRHWHWHCTLMLESAEKLSALACGKKSSLARQLPALGITSSSKDMHVNFL
ncbi:hypothetical protein DMH17_04890 [Raoultella planticola]|nr:hypothetical protein [Raoultella planticola]